MKKNLFYYLFTVICSVTLFASCSDDELSVEAGVLYVHRVEAFLKLYAYHKAQSAGL